jgi:acyloxyacyl hydrolase
MNELDMPMCSWGTGHVDLEKCPYQAPVPGADPLKATSIYSQMRERNRCNANDFQNIGVNGARITSSMGLVESLARNPNTDQQLLVYLALIGNDVCNGHTGYDHMTTPDEFYTHAMERYSMLDLSVLLFYVQFSHIFLYNFIVV